VDVKRLERLEKEKAFHNEAFSTGIRRPLDKYYSIFARIRGDYLDRLRETAPGKRLLECGCGADSHTFEVAGPGMELTGIDLSEEAVRKSREKAASMGLTHCRFQVMDAEKMDFGPDSFDLLFGVGIIHHLDLPVFFSEAARVLRPGGRILFMEPLGYNPVINLFRKLTPRYRTPDEHPLLRGDLKLLDRYFGQVSVAYYYFFALLAVPFRSTRLFSPLLKLLDGLDRFCFRCIPGFRYLAWYVLIDAARPREVRHS
jgi:SAM-dependent methyltransferase